MELGTLEQRDVNFATTELIAEDLRKWWSLLMSALHSHLIILLKVELNSLYTVKPLIEGVSRTLDLSSVAKAANFLITVISWPPGRPGLSHFLGEIQIQHGAANTVLVMRLKFCGGANQMTDAENSVFGLDWVFVGFQSNSECGKSSFRMELIFVRTQT
jgi:hypothetical protein